MPLSEIFRSVFEATPSAIVITQEDGRIFMMNPKAEEYFRYSAAELVGAPIETLIPNRYRKHHSTYRREYERAPSARPMGAGRELYALRKDGTEFPVEIGLSPIQTAQGNFVLSVIVDITARRQLEKEHRDLLDRVQQAQRMESLGVLAGGVAHDFNNLLTGILGNADLALLELSPLSPAREFLEAIQKSAVRASELCKQLLAYSGRGRFVHEPMDLNAMIREMFELLRLSISKSALIKTHLQDGLPAVDGDATQIRQVIMNLITNASDAIGNENGIITITTGSLECDHRYLSEAFLAEQLPEGHYVYLEISDTGCGMSKATRERIFDPFFTTKLSGRGLGLAAVLGIVRSHKGAIRVYSEEGSGTSFKVLLPASERIIQPDVEKRTDLEGRIGKGTVLVVDDEEAVRGVVRSTLSGVGFEVIVANDGQSGLRILEENGKDISFVVLDLIMPGMTGEEVLRQMRRKSLKVPVILMSGYHEQEISSRLAGKRIAGFIQKPLRPRVLLELIQRTLLSNT
ncbi:MAG TPA: PAS domain S-box protein [Acidobacteriota bacterium]|nr:PAS domain S-box protein [Acidobacteriota bacterium]